MRTVADMVRAQRQALAEARSNYRYEEANNQLSAITATQAAATYYRPSPRAAAFGEMAEMRVKNEVDAAIARQKKMGEPCPTGYYRGPTAECMVAIDQQRVLPTEFRGPTLLQNLESYNFATRLNRPTVVPGAATVSTLQGLGFAVEDVTCAMLRDRARDLLAILDDPNYCVIFNRTTRGVGFRKKVLQSVQAILAKCEVEARVASKSAAAVFRGGGSSAPASSGGAARYGNKVSYDSSQWASADRNKFTQANGGVVKVATDMSIPMSGLGYGVQAPMVNRKRQEERLRQYRAIEKFITQASALVSDNRDKMGPCPVKATGPSTDNLQWQTSMPSANAGTSASASTSSNATANEFSQPSSGGGGGGGGGEKPPEELPVTEPSFVQRYWWAILLAGGAGWYWFAKKP